MKKNSGRNRNSGNNNPLSPPTRSQRTKKKVIGDQNFQLMMDNPLQVHYSRSTMNVIKNSNSQDEKLDYKFDSGSDGISDIDIRTPVKSKISRFSSSRRKKNRVAKSPRNDSFSPKSKPDRNTWSLQEKLNRQQSEYNQQNNRNNNIKTPLNKCVKL